MGRGVESPASGGGSLALVTGREVTVGRVPGTAGLESLGLLEIGGGGGRPTTQRAREVLPFPADVAGVGGKELPYPKTLTRQCTATKETGGRRGLLSTSSLTLVPRGVPDRPYPVTVKSHRMRGVCRTQGAPLTRSRKELPLPGPALKHLPRRSLFQVWGVYF